MWITDKAEPEPEPIKTRPSDFLDADKINALPHPLRIKHFDGSIYDLQDIAVDAGICRFLVCGLVDHCSFVEISSIIDADGVEHNPDDFYNE